jgi:hypothetical protein
MGCGQVSNFCGQVRNSPPLDPFSLSLVYRVFICFFKFYYFYILGFFFQIFYVEKFGKYFQKISKKIPI